ncbi:hypothetical protein [Priestia megaterium]|uniref:hypothetical protein n=1 Tax=Priestia megaterium TaxID=1404 RepID=UPI000BFE6223|nr:hypothetical protein [Priestia megaterium]PGO60650.1 hypothetical protein CN981_08865 [Priestia megaterium]
MLNEYRLKDVIEQERSYLQREFQVDRIGVIRVPVKVRGKVVGQEVGGVAVTFKRPVGLEYFGLKAHLEDILGETVDVIVVDHLEADMAVKADVNYSLSEVEFL